jgi:hypothetical protein
MSRSAASAAAATALALTMACGPHGVSLGSEELCVADPLLTSSELLGGQELETVTSCASVGKNVLVNSGFEVPLVGSCQNGFFCQFSAADVLGWETTDVNQVIEIWNTGQLGVPSEEGAQFVELNADSQGTVWQEASLSPGQLMYWSLAHHGRGGDETFELRIGPSEAPASQGSFTSDADTWHRYSGLYRVGAAETLTRFELVSRTGAAEGNLIDATFFAPVDER